MPIKQNDVPLCNDSGVLLCNDSDDRCTSPSSSLLNSIEPSEVVEVLEMAEDAEVVDTDYTLCSGVIKLSELESSCS